MEPCSPIGTSRDAVASCEVNRISGGRTHRRADSPSDTPLRGYGSGLATASVI